MLHHFLVVQPLSRKIFPDLPLSYSIALAIMSSNIHLSKFRSIQNYFAILVVIQAFTCNLATKAWALHNRPTPRAYIV